ncbi:MAG: hypothetical protein U0931_40870 [Vulcanimicrobiota bacterium]
MEFGLEYLMLFGRPDAGGRISLVWPRLSQTQLALWVEQLSLWRGGRPFDLSLAGEKVELRLPLNQSLLANRASWPRRRELWSDGRGYEAGLCARSLLSNAGRLLPVKLSQSELRVGSDAWLAPLAHSGVQLVLEELNGFSQQHLLGPKRELYFQAGVRELWMLSAQSRALEVYQRGGAGLERVGSFGSGKVIRFQGCSLEVDRLLDGVILDEDPVLLGDDGAPVELQQLMMAGLPARACEYWDGWCRRFLPCASFEQAFRCGQELSAELQSWDPTRFRLHQRGMVLELAVRICGDVHRTFLRKAGLGRAL